MSNIYFGLANLLFIMRKYKKSCQVYGLKILSDGENPKNLQEAWTIENLLGQLFAKIKEGGWRF